ncbi:Sec7-like domain is implicated in guanine nucleotide exchange function [Vararia minispora EC-137]|uniref:Sec7-like domain is implicated in guanine nucleotide exchange function n=1 Tax=Vararia minispora EC-137 TaxID=1314806 RepID=A0ACB8QW76_9AGAM|nr:Sec7-like domain is implicated in guanine nucleotide exchange function [Vararia minispora EC-137]
MSPAGVSGVIGTGPVAAKHVVYAEILSVTTVMRKNSRWSSSSQTYNTRDSALASNLGLRRAGPSGGPARNGTEEETLMSAFEELKRELRNVQDVQSMPLSSVLAPFLSIIRSPLSTGPIASAALSAIHAFFACGLIHPGAVAIDAALSDFSSSISHCKFEASDSSGDEVVLLRILTVVEDCMCGSVGKLLDDVEVCEMLETVLTTCVQMRLSETLRRSAELIMHALVRTVFSRIHSLYPEIEEKKLENAQDHASGQNDISMLPAPPSSSVPPSINPLTESQLAPVESAAPEPGTVAPAVEAPRSEYGAPSLVELLRVVINILDPNERIHTDSTRLLALGILNTIFEASGSRLGDFPSLRSMVLDHGCKYLFQLARSENPSIFYLALRTVSTMLNGMRTHLKLQQELFLAFTLDRLAPPSVGKTPKLGNTPMLGRASPRSGTPRMFSPLLEPVEETEVEKGSPMPNKPSVLPARGETRELLLETLCQISQHPGFMVELFINYDCDINSENIFERLIDMLTKSVYSEYYGDASFGSASSQYLCLDLLLAFVKHMVERTSAVSEAPDISSAEAIMRVKSQKQLIQTGISRFNVKPKTGLAFLEENGLIYHDITPEDVPEGIPKVTRALSLARFFKSSTRLDKKVLGEFISRPENVDVLKAFVGLFSFEGKAIADAMRELLESFRLPGESQQIERITETFAECYFASKPAEIRSQDAVHVLSYSVILLNTDLHNPQIRKRMTIEDYTRNLRGVNDGVDFTPEFLQAVYESIRKREIVLPEEHTGQLGFEFAWKELLMRSRQAGDLIITNSPAFDKEMFKVVWKPVITTITYAFMNFDDDYVIERSIAGFRQCASLAGHFHLPDVFDYVVISLSQATSLLSDSLITEVPVYPMVEAEGQSITVSSLAVKFGANLKGQLAAVVLFNIMNRNGNAIREGWTQVFEIFQNLFIHSLLPTRLLQMEDFLGGVSMIPLRGNTSQAPRPAPRSDGLLSTLSSYLMTPYSAQEPVVPHATEADVESTLCALDCINTCQLEELYSQIKQLDSEPLVAALRSLEALAYERTVARLRQEEDEPAGDGQLTALDAPLTVLSYDPASVFLLETMVSIVCQTPQHIEELWPVVFEHVSALLNSSTRYSILLIERAVVALLRICLILATKSALRDQIYISLDLLGGLPSAISNSVAEQIISGVALIVQTRREVISSQTEWSLLLALVRATIGHLEAARASFALIKQLVEDSDSITVDSALPLIAVLDDFATAAGLIAEAESQQRQQRRRAKAEASNSPAIERGRLAVDLLFEVMKVLPRITEPASERWHQLALPILMALSAHAASAAADVRQAALSQLSRALLGPLVPPSRALDVPALFARVLYPLLDALLHAPASHDATEARVRAAGLTCKVFMRFEIGDESADPAEALDVWVRILEFLDALLRADRTDAMAEAVPESLKNVMLVMHADGLLARPPAEGEEDARTTNQRALWNATHERLQGVLPGFLEQVLPPPPPPPPPVEPPKAEKPEETAVPA